MSLRASKLLDFGASPETWDVLEDASNWRGADHRSGWNLDTTPVCGCAACGGRSPSDPQFFMPPSSGVAGNGLPIYSWDQAAAQLTRESSGWAGLGNPANVTFAFRATMDVAMPSGTSGFVAFNEAQITMTLEALALWSEVANITFTRVMGVDGYSNNATMLFSNYSAGADGASAFAYYPGSTNANNVAGDVWINFSLATNNSNLVEGAFGPHTMSHEIGHAIGLSHPADYDALDGIDPVYPDSAVYWQDGRMFTVMSYFGSSALGGSLNAFASGPQLHDIAAAQRLYGANMTTRTGDTVYGFNSNTGHAHFSITADGQSPVFAIWDAGGNDTIDFSGYSTAVEIDLREEAFSSAGPGNGGVGIAIGNVSIARGAIIENGIGGSGNDLLIGNAVANLLTGGDGADVINGNQGDDVLMGGAGADAMDGGDGSDTASYANSVHPGVHADLVTSGTNTGDAAGDTYVSIENLTGGSGNDTLSGDAGANIIRGGAGGDTLDGRGGADQMYGEDSTDTLYIDNDGDLAAGGDGDDTYYVYAVGATLVEEADGGGADWINLYTGSSYTLGANFEVLWYRGDQNFTGTGNNADNSIAGWGYNDVLIGLAGNDFLNGDAGDDLLNGGQGGDLLMGGLDYDTVTYADSAAGVTVNLQAGTASGGDAAGDTFSSVEALIGSAFADSLTGNNDNNIIEGGLGADTMAGGNGDDTYVVDNAGDVTSETSAVGGTDTVRSSLTRTLGANLENLILTGVGVISGFGNALNNTITGNDAANQLNGFDGADILDGGAGADNMFGGNGDDTYYIDNAGDQATETSALGGIDTVVSTLARNLTANIENLTLVGSANIDGSGNALNNTLIGNSGTNTLYGFDGNDRLDGGAGADTLFGANGDDTYVVDDVGDITVEGSPTGGIDTVESWISRNLNANFENMTLFGSATIAYGNTIDNVLTGNGQANALYGFDGNDTLNGRTGADQMFGGNGDDTYIVDHTGDVTSEVSALGGIDTVISSQTRNLTAFIENLTLSGSANINGAGNVLNNIITGNSGVNTLFGLDGDDTLDGGLGADTLQGGAGADSYAFTTALGGANVDAIVGFSVADDTIVLSNAVFTGLSAGALAASAFVIGAAAGDADDRVIYNSATGQLFFDVDGSDAGAAVLFATLTAGLSLTSADFIVGGP